MRFDNGAIIWSDYAWLDGIKHSMYTLHLLEAEPAGDGPEWHASVLRFFEIGEDDVCLMSDWRSYEAAGIRYGRDQVLTRLREFGEAEFVRAPERNVA